MKMKSFFIFLVLVLLLIISASNGDVASGERASLLLKKSLKAVVSDLNSGIPALMQKARIPGLQVALVRNNKVVWQRSYGVKNAGKLGVLERIQTSDPLDPESPLSAEGTSKPSRWATKSS